MNGSIALNALINAVIVLTLNAIAYGLWRRQLAERDTAIRLLNDQMLEQKKLLGKINAERLERIEHDITHAAAKRKEIYEHMSDKLVSQRHCLQQHAKQDLEAQRLEKQLNGIYAQLRENNDQTSRTAAIVELIAGQMNISVGAQTPGKGHPR